MARLGAKKRRGDSSFQWLIIGIVLGMGCEVGLWNIQVPLSAVLQPQYPSLHFYYIFFLLSSILQIIVFHV